jgi:hypothetical protein
MSRLDHIIKKNPGSGLDRTGGRYWHKAESYCDVINNIFKVAAQDRP